MNYMECGKCIYYTGGFCKEKGIIRDEREGVTDCKDFELKRFRLDEFEVDNDGWRQYFIFDDEKIHEHKFGRVVTIVNELLKENEELKKENEELKLDNDIKFWKQEYLKLSNHQQVIFHELAEAFKQGYKPSKEYQKMINDEKKRIEECKQKMERLRI